MADQTAHQQGKQEALKDKKHFIVEYFLAEHFTYLQFHRNGVLLATEVDFEARVLKYPRTKAKTK